MPHCRTCAGSGFVLSDGTRTGLYSYPKNLTEVPCHDCCDTCGHNRNEHPTPSGITCLYDEFGKLINIVRCSAPDCAFRTHPHHQLSDAEIENAMRLGLWRS